MTQEEVRRRLPRITRDTLMFSVGLIGVVHETAAIWVADQTFGERPVLLGVFVAMMGLPAFLHLDEKKGDPK